jgi:glycosyltransferase involved in cell wall biosynthesis
LNRADRVIVIPNGVDTARFNPVGKTAGLRERLGIGQAPLVGHIARLAPVKNQPLLVDAFAEARRRVPNAHLVIVGDGSERSAIEARIAAGSLQSCVHLIGEARAIPEILREIDAFALPSKAEGTSMSVLEAMASGVAVVASSVGGTPDLLNDGECGRLVPPNDVRALASGIADVLSDTGLRSALGSAGRARAVAHYSESTVTDRYERLYRVGRATSDGRAP